MPRWPSMPSIESRLWAKVNKSDGDGCWEWTGPRARGGYGILSHGLLRRAHRISWTLTNGPIPVGLWVLHRCDNPPCVRPEHLFLGTGADNIADRQKKKRGRWLLGEDHHEAKLTEENVRYIRASYPIETIKGMAARFGVSTAAVGYAARGHTWRRIR